MKIVANHYKAFVHGIVWLIFAVFQFMYFSSLLETKSAYMQVLVTFMFHLILFYSNWFIFVPRFYVHKKYLTYLLISLSIISLCTFLRIIAEKYFHIQIGVTIRQPIIDREIRPMIIASGACLYIYLTSFFLRIADLYTSQTRQKDLLQQQKAEAEIKFLKAQLNPHFLFNALNNIYALVLTRSEAAADSLMSLSQLLRYIIYEALSEKVSLAKEITYLNYYIDLETLRLTKKENLNINITVEPDGYTIMPMLFIPFVENSFKHSDINKDGKINVQMHLKENELYFLCENTYSSTSKSVDQLGGIGLENSRKRLEMVYPRKHKLVISNKENIFKVVLTINL